MAYFCASTTRIVILLSCMTYCLDCANGKSLEKQILDAAPSAGMFDLLHLTPDGEVMVMTEFDMLLTWKEYKTLYAKEKRSKRKALRDLTTRWTDCYVYYEIESSIGNDNDKKLIRQAMDEWEKYTCLTFRQNMTNQNRIQFRNGTACYSYVGMQRSPQPIALAPGCRTPGIIIHEIGHAIGWRHEQSRPDRDKYVKINLNSVDTTKHHNFDKYDNNTINNYDIEYDYTSIMHYGADAFKASITTLDPSYQNKIGQRKGLSFKDIKLANVMYRCAELMCSGRLPPCPYGGFVLSRSLEGSKYCECWCDSEDVNNPLILCSQVKRAPSPYVLRPASDQPVEKLCYDVREDCAEMKEQGKCMSDMVVMMGFCRKTCNFCGKGEKLCMDHEKSCTLLTGAGSCQIEALKQLCPMSCGLCAPSPPCEIQQEMMGIGRHEGNAKNSGISHFSAGLFPLIPTLLLLFVKAALWRRF